MTTKGVQTLRGPSRHRIEEDRKWLSSHTCKVAGLPLLLAHPSPDPCSGGTSPGEKKKKKRIIIDGLQFKSQSPSCIRGGSHFRAAVEPAMVVRDDPGGPPCAAPFKGRDSQSSCHSETPQPALAPGNEAGCILSTCPCPLRPASQPPTITRGLWHLEVTAEALEGTSKTGENKILGHAGARLSEAKAVSLHVSTHGWSWLKKTGLSVTDNGGEGSYTEIHSGK